MTEIILLNIIMIDQLLRDCKDYISDAGFEGGYWIREFGKYLLISFGSDINIAKITFVMSRHLNVRPYDPIDMSSKNQEELTEVKKWIINRVGDGKQQWRLEGAELIIIDLDEDLIAEFKLTWL